MHLTDHETRLSTAEPCGIVRDSHTMTLVRLSDITDVIDSLKYYREQANKLDGELTRVLGDRDSFRDCHQRSKAELENLKQSLRALAS